MSRTKIEWCDFSINPVKGLCPMNCSYCYARRMYKRFKWNPEIYYDDRVWLKQLKTVGKHRYFIGSTIELFGDWIKPEWMEDIFKVIKSWGDDDTFIFLTKQPQRLNKFTPYPDNCYIGVSVTNQIQYDQALKYLKDVDAKTKFLSIEPLLERIIL